MQATTSNVTVVMLLPFTQFIQETRRDIFILLDLYVVFVFCFDFVLFFIYFGFFNYFSVFCKCFFLDISYHFQYLYYI